MSKQRHANKKQDNAQAARRNAQHQQSLDVAKKLQSMEGKIASTDPEGNQEHASEETKAAKHEEDN